jgi:hypothetical protein
MYTIPAFGLMDSLHPMQCTAVNQRNGNLGNSIFVHFEMTFLTTLTEILDFANLTFQTGIFSQPCLFIPVCSSMRDFRVTGILDFANLIFQTGILSQFKLGKKSNWLFQTGEYQKFLKSQCR